MNRLGGAFLVAVIGIGGVVLPTEQCEAGLVDWLRCVVNPCRWPCGSPCAPACDVSSCPPIAQGSSYSNPYPQPCAVSYVRRCYTEPRTRMSTQTVLEPRPTYVRRRYWDPCSLSYKTYFETSTSYVRRSYCVPVTDYIQRSYLEPVIDRPTATSETDRSLSPPASTEAGPSPGASQAPQPNFGRRFVPATGPRSSARSVAPVFVPSSRASNRDSAASAVRIAPLALNSERPVAY